MIGQLTQHSNNNSSLSTTQPWILSNILFTVPNYQGPVSRIGNISGPECCFEFVVFAFTIKVSIILKMIQYNYQLKKENRLVCELGIVLPFNRL